MEIIIDEEFEGILPPLDTETYRTLEENIVAHGCIYPLVVWAGVLVDGHNRYRICIENGIPFETTEKEFPTREDALIWIISNQLSRRNLSPIQLSYYRGLHYRAEKKRITNIAGANQHTKEVGGQNDHQPLPLATARVLSDHYGVSPKTIRRDATLSAAIDAIGGESPEAKRALLSGEMRLGKKELADLSAMTGEEIREIASGIENGTYERRAAVAAEPEEPSLQSQPAQQRRSRAVDAVLAGLSPLSAADGMSGAFSSGVAGLGPVQKRTLKATLRVYIDLLESLYARL